MFTYQKFFNVDAPTETPSSSAPAMSIAEMMASKGSSAQSGFSAELPQINTENKETAPETPAEAAPVAPTTPTSQATEAISETPSATPETITLPEVPIEPKVETPVPSWQEVLKSQQPDTVLRELGFNDNQVKFFQEFKDLDPKMVAFLEHWKNNGDVSTYLRELSTDYSKMPAEEVMRHQLREEYPKASAQQIELLYKRVVNQFGLDSDDEAVREEGLLLMSAEADKHRDKFVNKQQNFLLPKAPAPTQPQPDPYEVGLQQEVEQAKQRLINDPYIKSFAANKSVTIGEGDDKFNYSVNPERVMELMTNPDKWTENIWNVEKQANGIPKFTPKTKEQVLIATFAADPIGFLTQYAQHHRQLGSKSLNDVIENAKKPEDAVPSKSEAVPKNAAEAMAKGGTVSYGNRP